MEALFRCILSITLIITPLLLALIFAGESRPVRLLAMIGPCAIAIMLLVPLALHLTGIPISRGSLAAAHGGLVLVGIGTLAVVRRFSDAMGVRMPLRETVRSMGIAGRSLGPILLLYATLVIPFSYIAGIDTYKWQDLASSIALDQTIPWLVHPSSLFGFTPRAYPSAQPLVLASCQILGTIGVDWGFYLVSLLTGFTAITGAYALGQRLYDDADCAWWLALLYGFSPLMMRYGYWATGRGFLLALLPFFIALLLDARRPRALLAAMGMGLLLALSHKAGLVATVLIPTAVFLSPLAGVVRSRRAAANVLIIGAVFAGLLLTPGPLAWAFRGISRFAWLLPLALLGLVIRPWTESREGRAIFAAALLLTPLAFADEPYGALLAAPLVASAAASGAAWLGQRRTALPPAFLRASLVGLVLFAAVLVVIRQAMDSPSRAVHQAARFLEAYDPQGPYRLEAPGRTRTQMQAYLSGCPRFHVVPPPVARLNVSAPPPLTGRPRSDAKAWTRWLRAWVDLPDTETAWYGTAPRVYYVRINASGIVPPDARPIYDKDGVTILTSP
jgi:hypothetical protein